tara:strand:- start:1052 stop:1234 length:183 start_codon:yes stop_codon:yes gene_type:complete
MDLKLNVRQCALISDLIKIEIINAKKSQKKSEVYKLYDYIKFLKRINKKFNQTNIIEWNG